MPKDKYLVGDAVNFGVVGAINTVIDFSLIALAQKVGLSIFWSILVGYAGGGVCGYILNNCWTYRRHNQPLKTSAAAKYISVSLIGWALTELIVYIVTAKLSYSIFVGKVIAIIIVFSWNFFANRHLTFHELKKNGKIAEEDIPDLTIPIE